jgi:hypothetical protein
MPDMALIKVETCNKIRSRIILNIVVIAPPLLFILVVTFGCHFVSAHGVGRFLHYSADCAILNTVKIAYSLIW